MSVIRGSCLCGGVRYAISGNSGYMGHCHCQMCRKSSGSAFGTYWNVPREDFAFTEGEQHLVSYPSSPGIERTFCALCGATLQFIEAADDRFLGVAAGTLDDDPVTRPTFHIWVGSMAPWYRIADPLPQHDTEPETRSA